MKKQAILCKKMLHLAKKSSKMDKIVIIGKLLRVITKGSFVIGSLIY